MLTWSLKNKFYINKDNTADMPTDTATLDIRAVGDNSVGM